MEVAIATHTSPADWWDEDEATLMTAVAVLEQVARASKPSKTRRGEDDNDGGS